MHTPPTFSWYLLVLERTSMIGIIITHRCGTKKSLQLYLRGTKKVKVPLWDKKAYIAYKMVTAAPKSLLGLQDKSEKLIARIKKKHPISHNP